MRFIDNTVAMAAMYLLL